MSTAINITDENLPESVRDLGNMIGQLAEKDRGFASDLVANFEKRGKLSTKQQYWVGVLLVRAIGIDTAPKAEEVGDLTGLIDLFAKAKESKKYPKISLEVNGSPLKLTLAGPKAKCPGTINVSDGGSWGDNVWYGRVTKEGIWSPTSSVTDELRSKIQRLLSAFAHNPAHAAMTFGKQTDHCCFCMKQLDTKESKHVGYGPICADKWGLPWGATE